MTASASGRRLVAIIAELSPCKISWSGRLGNPNFFARLEVIEPLGDLLPTLLVGPEHPGGTAGTTFELFYHPDYLPPHRRAPWLLMGERLADAAAFAERQGVHESWLTPVTPIAAAMRKRCKTTADEQSATSQNTHAGDRRRGGCSY